MHLIAMTRRAFPKGGSRTKTLLIMKLTAMLWLAACLQVSAKGNAQQISLSEKNAPLKKLFEEMRRQTGFLFFYDSKELRSSRPVTILVQNAGLKETLELCFKDQPLTY